MNSGPRQPDAEQSALAIRRAHRLSTKPPVRELTRVAGELGAPVHKLKPGPLAGMVSGADGCLEGSWEVSVDKSMPSHRVRFALAHELGHLYLRTADLAPSSEERWCNRFAAELLMPSAGVRAGFSGFNHSLTTLFEFARRYDVSRSAALVRLRHVLGWNSALVGLRLRNDRWQVAQMTCMPDIAMYQLTVQALAADLPKTAGASQRWLRFEFHNELLEVFSECHRRGTWTDVLVNAEDVERVCREISRDS